MVLVSWTHGTIDVSQCKWSYQWNTWHHWCEPVQVVLLSGAHGTIDVSQCKWSYQWNTWHHWCEPVQVVLLSGAHGTIDVSQCKWSFSVEHMAPLMWASASGPISGTHGTIDVSQCKWSLSVEHMVPLMWASASGPYQWNTWHHWCEPVQVVLLSGAHGTIDVSQCKWSLSVEHMVPLMWVSASGPYQWNTWHHWCEPVQVVLISGAHGTIDVGQCKWSGCEGLGQGVLEINVMFLATLLKQVTGKCDFKDLRILPIHLQLHGIRWEIPLLSLTSSFGVWCYLQTYLAGRCQAKGMLGPFFMQASWNQWWNGYMISNIWSYSIGCNIRIHIWFFWWVSPKSWSIVTTMAPWSVCIKYLLCRLCLQCCERRHLCWKFTQVFTNVLSWATLENCFSVLINNIHHCFELPGWEVLRFTNQRLPQWSWHLNLLLPLPIPDPNKHDSPCLMMQGCMAYYIISC